MRININRRFNRHGVEYCITENATPFAKSNYTLGLLLKKVCFHNNFENDKYILKQRNIFMKIFSVPFRNFLPDYVFSKYYLYRNGVICGKTKSNMFSSKIYFLTEFGKFELYSHPHNHISVMKDGIQVALILKSTVAFDEKHCYTVFYDHQKISQFFSSIVTVLCDLCYYHCKLRIGTIHYEENFGRDKYPDRAEWRPSDYDLNF